MGEESGKKQGNKGERAEYMAFLCDRVQKITGAVYRVTDLLPDKEPLKWVIRENVVTTLNNIISIKDKKPFERAGHLMEINDAIDKIIVLFTIFSESNTFAGSNFNILIEEYNAIKKDLASEIQSSDIKLLFSDMSTKKYSKENSMAEGNPQEISNGHSNGPNYQTIGQSNGQINDNGQEKVIQKESPHDPTSKKIEPKPAKGEIPEKKKSNWTNKERKNKIFEIVKSKGKITVGELSGMFAGFSEKTLQRDLVEMVRNGLLRKEGDKRWRTYIFNNK